MLCLPLILDRASLHNSSAYRASLTPLETKVLLIFKSGDDMRC